MYFKKFSFILIFSFLVGIIVSYYNRIDGEIILYPKLGNNNTYCDDKGKTYTYEIIKIKK